MIKKIIFLLILCFASFFTVSSFAQINENYNKVLQSELIEIQKKDQKYRAYFGKINSSPAFNDSLLKSWRVEHESLFPAIWERQLKIDEENLEKVNEIRKDVGFKGNIDEYASSIGIDYEVYTLKELKQITDTLPYPKRNGTKKVNIFEKIFLKICWDAKSNKSLPILTMNISFKE